MALDWLVVVTYAGATEDVGLPHQLTIRYDDALAREIEDLARREGIALDQAAVSLLRKGARIAEPDRPPRGVIGDSLDWFIGSWSPEQTRELDAALADFEVVDEDLWR